MRISVTEDKTKQGIDNFKKHLTDFLGLKEQFRKLGLGSFELKLYRLVKGNGKTENYSILTQQQQLDLELPQILAGESDSELNGEYIFHSRLTLNYCCKKHSTERLSNNLNDEVICHFDRNCASFVFLLLLYYVQR